MSEKRSLILLLAVALVTYLVGNARVSLWDRDEPRYAQTSRQMLQSGDWVVPRLYDTVRTAKPVLIYWCEASCMAVMGSDGGAGAAAARLPSAIAMVATLAIVAIVIGGQRGLLTAFILGSSLLVFWSAKSALTDSVLLLFVTITQLSVRAMWMGKRSWWLVVVLAVAVGLGGLTKGPVVVAYPGVTLLVLIIAQRRVALRADRYAIGRGVVGVGIVALITVPWMILVEKRAPGFLTTAIRHEVVDRARNPQEGHAGPPGYYLATIWLMYFPWSLLLPGALIAAWRRREKPEVRFALAAIVGPWMMLEIIRTKLPHYLLPAYPFLALLTADLLIDSSRSLITAGFKRIVTGWAILVAVLALLPWIVLHWFSLSMPAVIGLVAFSIIALEYAWQIRRAFLNDHPKLAATIMGAGMFLLIAVLHLGFLPEADFLQVSWRVAALLPKNRRPIMIDYKEPSLAFYQGGTIREEARNDYLTTVPPVVWPNWIVISREQYEKTPPERKALLNEIGSVHGLDVAGKGIVDVVVLHDNQ